jgi:hypothetical protein
MKIVDKPCERCGEMMFSVAPNQKYCPNCRKAVEVEQRKATTEKRREERKRRTVEKHCEFCGKAFETSNKKKIYCSPECCSKANNAAGGRIVLGPSRRKPPKISADEVTAAANAEGLTYGQYSVKHGLYADIYGKP